MAQTRIHPYDCAAVKNALDDSVVKYFCEKGPRKEDFTNSNIRILLGSVSVAAAVTSHFYPLPWPDNRVLLITLVGLYMLCSLVSYLHASFMERDIILTTYPSRVMKSIVVSSGQPRFSEDYTITLWFKEAPNRKETRTWSIGKFFTQEGELLESKLFKELHEVYGCLENKKTK